MRAFIAATTLGDLLDRQAAERPDAEAVVFPDSRHTYAGLAGRAQRMARGLVALGVVPGDRVGILMPASANLLAVLFGAAKVGAIAVPVNSRFSTREVAGLVRHSGMAVLVRDEASADLVPTDAPELRHTVTATEVASDDAGAAEADHGTAGSRAEAGADHAAGSDRPGGHGVAGRDVSRLDVEVALRQESVRVRDTAVIVYTSGTTAAPKGAMLSHEALTRLPAGIAERMALTPDDRVWTAIPLFHGGGISFALSCVTAGAPFVHPGSFDPSSTPAFLSSERVTVALAAFETIWMPVLHHPDLAAHDLSRIRLVMVVGVPERLRDMAQRMPQATHVSCVAMTESSAFLTLGRLDDPPEAFATTGGPPMPGMRCRVVDPDTGHDVPPGTDGELWFRGPNAFDGYFRDPAETSRVIDDDGWIHSGDVVVADDSGRLTFRSRLKDMLKVGGENVAAAEVEGHLLTHPAVGIVAVVAAPDAHYVEVPAAFVQLSPGATATEQELIAHCLDATATYRVPRYVRFVTDWPMSGTKIRKVELRERIAAELQEKGITEAPRLRSARSTTHTSAS